MERNKTLERVGGFSTDLRHEVESGSLFSRQKLASMLAVIAILSPSEASADVLQGDPSDSVVEGHYGPISSTNQTSLVNGKLVMSNNAVNYITPDVGLNGGGSGGEFIDANGDIINIQGLNGNFAPILFLPYACFGGQNVNGTPHAFFVNLIDKTAVDLTEQYNLSIAFLQAGFFANDNEVMIYTGQGKSSFKVNIYNNSIVAIPYNTTFEQKLQNSIDGRLNIARLELGSQNVANAGFSLVSKNGISVAYGDSNGSIVLHDPEVEQSEMDLDMGFDMEVSDMGAEEMGGVDMSYEGTEDMGIIVDMARLDMGNSNNDMSVSVDGDLGLEDMGSGVVKTNESKGDGCNVVNPTAPMHKTPGGLTLLFASALTVAAGFRKKGKKSE